MSSFPLGELAASPRIPQLDLRGDFEAGKRGEMNRKGGKRKEDKGREKVLTT